jgi:hypothetical protein
MRKCFVVIIFGLMLASLFSQASPAAPSSPASKEALEQSYIPVPVDPDDYFLIIDRNEPKPPLPEIPPPPPKPIPQTLPNTTSNDAPRGTRSGDGSDPSPEERQPRDQGRYPAVDPDAYEPDNSVSDYTYISPSLTLNYQSHSLHTTTDQDWFRFYGYSTRTYIFYSTGTTDTRIYLYDDTGSVLIDSDNQTGIQDNYMLQFTPPAGAYYKLKVNGYLGDTGLYSFYYAYGSSPDSYEEDDSSSAYTYISPSGLVNAQMHTLDSGTDQDWFRFYGYTGRTYTFWSTGYIDPIIYIYQDDGNTLIAYDDQSGTDDNFSLSTELPANGYYKAQIVGWGGSTGYYCFQYYCWAPPDAYEPDNDSSSCTNLYAYALLSSQSHTIHNTSDQDWFEVYVNPGCIYHFESTGNTDVCISMYDADGTTFIDSDDDDGVGTNFLLEHEFTAPGSCKLKVYGYGTNVGAYNLTYYIYANPDAYEPDDDAGFSTPVYITSAPTYQSHTLHNGNDVDWYRFQAVPGRLYVFSSTSMTDTRIYLYEDDGTTLLNWDDDDGEGLNYYLVFAPSVYTYYKLKVTAYSSYNAGAYNFNYVYTATADAYEPDDTSAEYTELTITAGEQVQYHTLHSSTDADWFRFNAFPGRTYTFWSSGNTDVRIYLYDYYVTTELGFNDDGAGYPNFFLQYAPTSSAYFLKVDGWGGAIGAYDLHYSYSNGLTAPFYLHITRSGGSIVLNWCSVLGATSYRVEVSDRPYSGFVPIAIVNAPTTSWTSSPTPIRRFYRIKALN